MFAIVALLAAGATQGFRSLRKADLREATTQLSGAMRYLFDRASTTGKVHRLVIDMETGSYWAEVSDDRFFIPREETEEQVRSARGEGGDGRRGGTKKREQDERAAASGKPASANSSFDLSKLEVGDFRPKRARVRLVQGPGAQAGEAQEGEGPERLHPARRRRADQRGAATSISSRSGRPSRRSSRCRTRTGKTCFRWSCTRSRGACASTTRRSCRPPGATATTTGRRVMQ